MISILSALHFWLNLQFSLFILNFHIPLIWNILIYYSQLWIFSPLSTQTFDFWCLPEDLTRIIKLIYSHIRNWSLNWWIFKAIKAGIHWSTIPRAELNMLMISLNTITIQMIIMMKLKRILSWLTTSQQHQM